MVQFTATLRQFAEQGEKTGWTYIEIPADLTEKIKPGTKTAYRVKGKLDDYVFEGISLTPMGGGRFIMALNATIRKAIRKNKGAMVQVSLAYDKKGYQLLPELLECLRDDPRALAFFNNLPRGHQNYFSKWIESAKTDVTKAKRIALAVNAASRHWGYPEMIRAAKKDKDAQH